MSITTGITNFYFFKTNHAVYWILMSKKCMLTKELRKNSGKLK